MWRIFYFSERFVSRGGLPEKKKKKIKIAKIAIFVIFAEMASLSFDEAAFIARGELKVPEDIMNAFTKKIPPVTCPCGIWSHTASVAEAYRFAHNVGRSLDVAASPGVWYRVAKRILRAWLHARPREFWAPEGGTSRSEFRRVINFYAYTALRAHHS